MDKNEKYDFNSSNHGKGPFRIKWFGLFVAMFWAFFFALALSNVLSPYFSQIITGLLSGISPILIAIVVAFIFSRFVDFIENVILKNAFKNNPYKFGIKRTISILIVLAVIIGIIALVFSILVPKIIEVVQRLTVGGGDGGVEIYNKVVNDICDLLQKWFGAEVSQETIKAMLTQVFETFMQTVGYLNNVLELSMSVVGGIFNFIIGLLIAVLMLKDKEKITKFSRRFTYANVKKERADEICVLTKNATNILYNYVVCKLIEFGLIFVSLGIAYSCLNLEFTWELALIVGLFNFIPYFGIYIGTLPAVLITLIFNSINSALYLTIVTIIITTIEFNCILPFITGKKLKVSSLLVVGSIIVGGAMFGMIGMLLAPPIVALISVVITGNIELKENHIKYMMELNKAREKNKQEEDERLNITNKNSDIDENKIFEDKISEDNKSKTNNTENQKIQDVDKKSKVKKVVQKVKRENNPSSKKDSSKAKKPTKNKVATEDLSKLDNKNEKKESDIEAK